MSFTRGMLEEIDRRIAKALRDAGIVGQTIDASHLGGSLPSGVGMSNPMTTAGDLIVGGSGGTPTRLAVGSNGQVLTVVSGAPAWASGGAGGDSTTADTYANRPAAGNAGDLFFPTDGFQIERDSGAAWRPWGPIFPFTAPVDADYSWVNQGTASVVTTNGGIFLSIPGGAGGGLRLRVKSAPATPYTITAFMMGAFRLNGHYGLAFRQSSDGKLHSLTVTKGTASATPARVTSTKWTNESTFSAHYVQDSIYFYPMNSAPPFLQISDNGTNRICRVSWDGVNFVQVHSVGRTDFLTADQVGFYANNEGESVDTGALLLSWRQS